MRKEIYFAGGCFWGVEKYFSLIKGVVETETGYANGTTENPSYEDVCRKNTGHAETVRVVYDTDQADLAFLLQMLYKIIDPTQLNRQGNDIGIQYRTGIYYTDTADRQIIEDSLRDLQKAYPVPLAVEAGPLEQFYRAEDYHQDYLGKNPAGYCHIPSRAFQEAQETNKPVYQKKTDEQLKKELNELEYQVTMKKGTEPPFANKYNSNFEKGIYVDITTGEPLFASSDKFESGCGWPSFARPIDTSVIKEKKDFSHGMIRTEVRSKTGDAHLGHVFKDGPEETGGLRYCINSAALRFIPYQEMEREGYGYCRELLEDS